jgi:2-dehydropantoate 2-reductase
MSFHKGGAAHTVYRTGEVHGGITDRAHEVCRLVANADSGKVTDNLWGERWSKLVANTMANGVSACTGLSGAQIAQNEAIRHFQARLGSEAIRIGEARGYKLEEIDHLPPETIARAGRATPRPSRPTTSGGCRGSGAARPINGRRWAKTWPRAGAPRSST